MKEIFLNPHAFSKMDYLRFLIVNYTGVYNNVHGFERLEFDFTELRCLYWHFYPFTSLPPKFHPQNLVVLKMHNNNLEQLWSGIKDLANIKYIDLSYSERLRKVPDLCKAQNLERLILEGCTSLLEISAPSQNLDKLVNLNLRNCKSLINLPIGIQSKSLRDVILSGCSNLNTAPRISRNMEQLCLDETAIKELSSSIESPSRLVELNLQGCSRLESLPSGVCNLNSLRQLNLSDLSNLKFVLGIPCNIKELYLDGSAIKELSSSIENASSLVRLSLKDCSSLESLPYGICRLKSLKYLCISGCSKLDRLPEDIGDLESLEVLEADGITIREVPSSMGRLKNIQDLSFEGCKSQELECSLSPILPSFLFLRRLNLNHCSFTELPNNLGELSFLEELLLDGNNFESIPTSIFKLSDLDLLSIRFCNRLQSLPKLPCTLHKVKADGCKLLKVLSGFKIPSRCYIYSHIHMHNFSNCFNLDWNAVGMIFNEVLLEAEKGTAGTGCMVFPGSEIPEWFDIQSNGSRIELPGDSFNYKFLGFVVCAVVGRPGIKDCFSPFFSTTTTVGYSLSPKFQNGSGPIDRDKCAVGDIKSDHLIVWYNLKTYFIRYFNACTKAIINFYSSDHLIKKCGVRLLFSEKLGEGMKRSKGPIIDEEEAHSKRLKSSIFFKGESSSRENFELGLNKVMSEVEEQVVSNNNVNSGYNKVDGEQQNHVAAAAAGVGNEGGMRHGRGNGQNVVVGNAGGYGRGNWRRGNMQGMGNRGLSGPMLNRGPVAVGGRGMIGNGGNGFGQGIGGAPPLMHPHSIRFGPGFGAPMGRMGSYGGFLGAPSPPFSGESSSRSHPFTPLDSDEFPQVSVASPIIFISDSDEDNDGDIVKSQPFTPLDLNEFPQDSGGSPIIIISDSDEDNGG